MRLSRLAVPPSRLGPALLVHRSEIAALVGLVLGGVISAAVELAGTRLSLIELSGVLLIGICYSIFLANIGPRVRKLREGPQPVWLQFGIHSVIVAPLSGLGAGLIFSLISRYFEGVLGSILGVVAALLTVLTLYVSLQELVSPMPGSGSNANLGAVLIAYWSIINLLLIALPVSILAVYFEPFLIVAWASGVCVGTALLYCLIRVAVELLWASVARMRATITGLLPLRLSRFLHWAVDHHYFQRAGDAYMWFHPHLANYLARTSGVFNIRRFLLVEVEPLLEKFDRSDYSQADIWPQLRECYSVLRSIALRIKDPVVISHIEAANCAFANAERAVDDVHAFYSRRSAMVHELREAIDAAERRRFRGAGPKASL